MRNKFPKKTAKSTFILETISKVVIGVGMLWWLCVFVYGLIWIICFSDTTISDFGSAIIIVAVTAIVTILIDFVAL